jgi:hypothetical protein
LAVGSLVAGCTKVIEDILGIQAVDLEWAAGRQSARMRLELVTRMQAVSPKLVPDIHPRQAADLKQVVNTHPAQVTHTQVADLA